MTRKLKEMVYFNIYVNVYYLQDLDLNEQTVMSNIR